MQPPAALKGITSLFAALFPAWVMANTNNHQMPELHPGQDVGFGLSYESAWQTIPKTDEIQYGIPLIIQITEQNDKVYFDISTSRFDDIVVRVPLEELLEQPNRVGPPPEKPQ
ncbi:MAG: hypothetical protein KF789_00655 [Bdellovibrionaceae bacterium]|nr:hypothetical protein [Pseudobdellovibrionaceae bacterium]